MGDFDGSVLEQWLFLKKLNTIFWDGSAFKKPLTYVPIMINVLMYLLGILGRKKPGLNFKSR